ncbi:hypothetical protein VB636_16260, partial [Paracoccus sp. APAP_BH8]|uniref:hypothetical protein n=1 Tax=Paracoccus sp. APAP_BH8 TaxID=3110237 RepID=UPI002FD7B7A2
ALSGRPRPGAAAAQPRAGGDPLSSANICPKPNVITTVTSCTWPLPAAVAAGAAAAAWPWPYRAGRDPAVRLRSRAQEAIRA